ncbi:MAG: preprotein translocase subunit SecG [Chitinophagales bacterium]|nr:preprotein translocase subunit SecG [Chitinophagales bacterium]MDW8428253.1 preprotein translocase subunit SecG [Chitinophagales bacterium]
MYTFLIILIIIACILLMIVVLIQNPKGGGLGQTFGGLSNQFFGVQQTTDFLEKASWTLMAVIAGLSIATYFFHPKPAENEGPRSELEQVDLGGEPVLPAPENAPVPAPEQ